MVLLRLINDVRSTRDSAMLRLVNAGAKKLLRTQDHRSFTKVANPHARCPKCRIYRHKSPRRPVIFCIQLPPRTNAKVHRVPLSPRISLNACAPRFPQGNSLLSLLPQHSLAMKYLSPALCEPARSKSAHWKMVCEERRNFRCVARSKTCQEI